MLIPEKFEQFGCEITVEYDDELEHDECLGKAYLDMNKIKLTTRDIPRDMLEHSFLHEVVHFFLDKLGLDELNKDEAKVDAIAGLWHQYEKSKIINQEERELDGNTRTEGRLGEEV